MSCCIPGCSNRHVQWTTPLPRDELLLSRWNAAIRAGTGRSLVEAQICNAHFAGIDVSQQQHQQQEQHPNQTEYQEPTLFCRNNAQLQVAWCRLCLRHDSVDSMFEVNERPPNVGQPLSWMANKHFGVWLHSEQPSERQYFCEKCKVRLEATHGFWQEIQEAAEQYQKLRQKMSVEKLTFQKLEPNDRVAVQELDRSKLEDPVVEEESHLITPQVHEFPSITDDELELEVPPAKKRILSNNSQSAVKMFAVVEFIGTPILKVVAVPTAWLKDDLLMWPKLVNGEMIDKMRQDGFQLDDTVESEDVSVIVLQKFEQFQSAEAAAQAVSKRRNPEPTTGPSINAVPVVPKETLTYKAFRNEIHGLKRDLNTLVQTAVEAAAERSFRTNLNRFSSVFGVQSSTPSNSAQPDQPRSAEPETGTAEKHKKISNEHELDEWNTQLADASLCQKYLEYFAKIIFPNSCLGKGDNALYTIVDYLFTRDFWNHFTWTGISRGQKSDRGFREFGNVTHLLLNIVRLGDYTYDARKLEAFCRTRLFRYCKARSARQQIRRSSCRPRRKRLPGEPRRTASSSRAQMDNSVTDDAEQSMICKVEVDSDEAWRQSEDTNPDQNSDSMM
ncbi:uncharacterized protein LOC135703065 [Ochlerotatus camptorhynchus]|uniref:uncharacterized protein LOC135703065 n=1 Tax=Ochlerotatus camptorhynchus TaxID=644619 RepID=UPI0031CF03C1